MSIKKWFQREIKHHKTFNPDEGFAELHAAKALEFEKKIKDLKPRKRWCGKKGLYQIFEYVDISVFTILTDFEIIEYFWLRNDQSLKEKHHAHDVTFHTLNCGLFNQTVIVNKWDCHHKQLDLDAGKVERCEDTKKEKVLIKYKRIT